MKMYDGVLQRVRKLEQKNGIYYADTDGKIYKTAKVFLIIAFIYNAIINALYLTGTLLVRIDEMDKYFVTPAVCLGIIVVGFVLMLLKKHIIGAPLVIVPAAVSVVFFRPLLEGEYVGTVQAKFYWGHLAPAILLVLTALIMAFVAIRAQIKLRKMYNRVVENIYNTYKVNFAEGEDIDEKQWEEFLEKFDPYNYNQQFEKTEEKSEE